VFEEEDGKYTEVTSTFISSSKLMRLKYTQACSRGNGGVSQHKQHGQGEGVSHLQVQNGVHGCCHGR